MEIFNNFLRILFIIFLIYTFVFILQWVTGLFVSSHRLAQYHVRKHTVKAILPDDIAAKFPVSVIIPAYNEEDCINKTVFSILNEDYPDINILVVDDGSTDDTSKTVIDEFDLIERDISFNEILKTKRIVACYEKEINGKKITLITKKNGGKADSLNCGLNVCQSPYCLIVDADTEVEKGSIRSMVSTFLKDKHTIVCAGVVSTSLYGTEKYKSLSFMQKALVLFQQLEYYRTFYMQRMLFDRLNANVVVSGAFAMFDAELLKSVGGYKVSTIGEDMELTMRLHAFCHSQKRKYRIAYCPEVKCTTQVPFRYTDYYQQRRRWHIGMIQSLNAHKYMLGSYFYGGAGIIAGTFIIIYELFAPIIEFIGVLTIIAALIGGILNLGFSLTIIFVYALFSILTQLVLISILKTYNIEKISAKERIGIILTSIAEPLFFHPLNMYIKVQAAIQSRKEAQTWKHIERAKD